MSVVRGTGPVEFDVPEIAPGGALPPDATAPRTTRAARAAVTRLPGFLLRLALGLAATLVVSVRVQLAILERYTSADWAALAGGLLAGGLVLFAAVAVLSRLLLLAAIPLLMLTAGCLSVTHFPEGGFRSAQLRGEWDRLHPTLRLSLWIARLGGDVVLTDVARRPPEYGRGLPEPGAPGPFPQSGRGYARAVDLRTPDGGDLGNWARRGLFLALGLKAERHAGAPGYLQVSLPPARPRQPVEIPGQ